MHELISATQATSESMAKEDPSQQNLTSHNISPIHAYKATPILLAFLPIPLQCQGGAMASA